MFVLFSLEDFVEAAVRGKIIQPVSDCIRGLGTRALPLRTFQARLNADNQQEERSICLKVQGKARHMLKTRGCSTCLFCRHGGEKLTRVFELLSTCASVLSTFESLPSLSSLVTRHTTHTALGSRSMLARNSQLQLSWGH